MSIPALKVLGTYGVLTHNTYVTPTSRMVRGLMVVLTCNGNRRISTSTLREALWDEPKESANANLRTYIAQLRTLLKGHSCSVTTHRGAPSSYSLSISEDQLDLWRFRRLVQNGRSLSGTDPVKAMTCYEAALNLWRGDDDGILPDTMAMRAITTGWNLEYSRALAFYAKVAIAQRRTTKLITHLYRQATQNPHDSTVTSMLKAAILADEAVNPADLPIDLALAMYSPPRSPRCTSMPSTTFAHPDPV